MERSSARIPPCRDGNGRLGETSKKNSRHTPWNVPDFIGTSRSVPHCVLMILQQMNSQMQFVSACCPSEFRPRTEDLQLVALITRDYP